MATTKIVERVCDRCHRLRQHEESMGLPPGWREFQQMRPTKGMPHVDKTFDMCSPCVAEFTNFMDPERTEA